MVASAMLIYKERNHRECASMSSHHSNHCYAAILIGKMDKHVIAARQAFETLCATNDPTSSILFLYKCGNCHD